ncbi:UDP-N-acetylglucosamine 2-epimerase [Herbaspirillum seropedicae]|uniref:UDP-N-acetylglucosamine 2-epimerase n=1 Tax=Herbaspirillum seropedicae TaxID=964 RepID=UPI000AF517C8|nr:UDP-N-acetylglucosamine 2-epimerase [Herbaspirillum seropedicae]
MTSNAQKRVMFLTGTRADFGKLKPLIRALGSDERFDVHVFITGMHMLRRYGYTCLEVEKSGFRNLHKYINQNLNDAMDHVLSKTISGLSDYVREVKPDLMVIHGDRVEALAAASVGAFNNILTAHIEGGEVSGTIDESVRHAVTKLSHVHFVAHDAAKRRLIQLGELDESVYVIGSPDIDVMESSELPLIEQVRAQYEISFADHAVVLFHPVTTEVADLERQTRCMVDQLLQSGLNYVVIYPNNDTGSELIFREYARLENNPRFRIFPSMRFESFLTLLKHARFIIGNSSAGIREAPHFGTPTINLGSRQKRRAVAKSIIDTSIADGEIAKAINIVKDTRYEPEQLFGLGDSAGRFHQALQSQQFWDTQLQKHFVDQ